MRKSCCCFAVLVLLAGCGLPPFVGDGGPGGSDGGSGGSGGSDGGGGSGGDGGSSSFDGGDDFRFVALSGMTCALGSRAGIGYAAGASDEVVLFLQGGGACW